MQPIHWSHNTATWKKACRSVKKNNKKSNLAPFSKLPSSLFYTQPNFLVLAQSERNSNVDLTITTQN